MKTMKRILVAVLLTAGLTAGLTTVAAGSALADTNWACKTC